MKIGFIGTGNMGTILIESFIESKAADPSNITITNRTIEKALHIKTATTASTLPKVSKSSFLKMR